MICLKTGSWACKAKGERQGSEGNLKAVSDEPSNVNCSQKLSHPPKSGHMWISIMPKVPQPFWVSTIFFRDQNTVAANQSYIKNAI